MSVSVGTIYALYEQRRGDRMPFINRWQDIRDAYQSDLIVPLPELSAKERVAVPNLIGQGIDQMAMRISSTTPNVVYPPLKPHIKDSVNKADMRRKANLSWYTASNVEILLGRRARHHVAYGLTCVQIVPDLDLGMPRWKLRNPLSTFPAQMADPDDTDIPDCVFSLTQTVDALGRGYPELASTGVFSGPYWNTQQRWTTLTYCDKNETVTCVIGPALSESVGAIFAGLGKEMITLSPATMGKRGQIESVGESVIELDRVPNRANVCPVVAPGRITLGRLAGMFESMVGMYEMSARLMALEVIAVEQAIYPDLWAEARPNETVNIIAADGRAGKIGEITGGTLQPINLQPGTQTGITLDRLERAQRQNGGLPAQFGGEAPTNIRTGRMGDSVISATVDFHIQEAQKIFANSMAKENKIAVAIARAYFGKQRKSFTINWPKAKGTADYVPDEIFAESDVSQVSYARAGADINSLTVGLGQLQGEEMISKKTSRQLHPLIDDPDFEEEQIVVEQLQAMTLASLGAQVQQGAVSLDDLNFISEQVISGKKTIIEALQAAQKRAQTRQASAGAPGTPEGPAEPGSPEAQPGLSPQTPGAAPPTIGPPAASISNLSDLVRRLHGANAAAQAGPATSQPGQPALVPSGGAPVGG